MIIDPMEIGAPQSIFGGFVDNRSDPTGQNLIEYNFAKAETIKYQVILTRKNLSRFFIAIRFGLSGI